MGNKRNRPGGKKRKRFIRAITARDRDMCFWCKEPFSSVWLPTLDHLQPRAYGGTNSQANLVLACQWCNRERGDLTVSAWIARLAEIWIPQEERKINAF